MELDKMKSHIYALIRKLRETEYAYREIGDNIDNNLLSDWLEECAKEKHKFHRELALCIINLGGDIEQKKLNEDDATLFHDLKLSNFTDNYEAILNEIERVSHILRDAYEKVLEGRSFTPRIHDILTAQNEAVLREYDRFLELRDRFLSVPSSD